MHHRFVLWGLLASTLLAPAAAAPTVSTPAAAWSAAALQTQLQQFARRARPGRLGIAVLDVSSGQRWGVDADEPFIMMSAFKAPVVAAVLDRVDAGTLALEQQVTLAAGDFIGGSAVPSIGAQLQAGKTVFTLRELMLGAVTQSDNTAVDKLIKVLGGPQAVTAFLRRHGIEGMGVETDERDIARVADHLQPGETVPPHETRAQAARREKLGYADLMADPRNRATPRASLAFLQKLSAGELLAAPSTALLIDLMRKQTIPSRLRAGMPPGADFADKTGTSVSAGGRTAAWNDTAIVTLADGRRICIAVFLRDTAMPRPTRDALFADIARAVAAGVPPLSASGPARTGR